MAASIDRFTSDEKLLIVQMLACYYTPTEVQRALQERFKRKTTLPAILFYDPTTAQGARELADEWKEMFTRLRKEFLESESSIPIAHKAYRLAKMQRILDDPMMGQNPELVLKTMEQAAKESGGSYTNRREVTGKDGGAIELWAKAGELRKKDARDLIELHRDLLTEGE